MFLKTLLLLVLVTLILGDSDLEKLLKDTKIIPDVLHTTPKEKLKLEFENGLIAGDGKEFTPTQTTKTPKLDWSADPNKYYTVYMSCADAPEVNNPTWREFLHWLVVNVPGKDVDKGDAYCPYIGPMPPKSQGFMRYIFLVYEQPDKLEFDEQRLDNSKIDGHQNFKIEKFAKKYGMEEPLAGNVFRAQWDEHVIILHKKMGIVLGE